MCDTIVRGHLPKRFGGLESPGVCVVVADSNIDFNNLVEIEKVRYQMILDNIK